jgi:hypothetical protein
VGCSEVTMFRFKVDLLFLNCDCGVVCCSVLLFFCASVLLLLCAAAAVLLLLVLLCASAAILCIHSEHSELLSTNSSGLRSLNAAK